MRLICIVVRVCRSLILIAVEHPVGRGFHNLFCHSTADVRLGRFRFEAVRNHNAAGALGLIFGARVLVFLLGVYLGGALLGQGARVCSTSVGTVSFPVVVSTCILGAVLKSLD